MHGLIFIKSLLWQYGIQCKAFSHAKEKLMEFIAHLVVRGFDITTVSLPSYQITVSFKHRPMVECISGFAHCGFRFALAHSTRTYLV